MKAAITHSSVVLPGVHVANERPELTGISWLRHANQNEKASDLATVAIRAIDCAATDTLIVATTSADVPSPATAHRVLAKLNWPTTTLGFDVTSSCTSFLSALFSGGGFLNEHKSVCVVASEVKNTQIAQTDTRLKSLFGDGACAVILKHSGESEFELAYTKVRHDLAGHIGVNYFDGQNPQLYIHEPKRMYREILREMFDAILELWDKRAFKLKSQGSDPQKARGLIYVHQANAKLLEDLRERLPYEIGSRLPILISDIGNTVSASLPLLRARSAFLLAHESGCSIQTLVDGNDLCYVTLYSGEKFYLRDCNAHRLGYQWISELSLNERNFFKEIAPGQGSQAGLLGCDVWVAAGGGFQTMGFMHQYLNHFR